MKPKPRYLACLSIVLLVGTGNASPISAAPDNPSPGGMEDAFTRLVDSVNDGTVDEEGVAASPPVGTADAPLSRAGRCAQIIIDWYNGIETDSSGDCIFHMAQASLDCHKMDEAESFAGQYPDAVGDMDAKDFCRYAGMAMQGFTDSGVAAALGIEDVSQVIGPRTASTAAAASTPPVTPVGDQITLTLEKEQDTGKVVAKMLNKIFSKCITLEINWKVVALAVVLAVLIVVALALGVPTAAGVGAPVAGAVAGLALFGGGSRPSMGDTKVPNDFFFGAKMCGGLRFQLQNYDWDEPFAYADESVHGYVYGQFGLSVPPFELWGTKWGGLDALLRAEVAVGGELHMEKCFQWQGTQLYYVRDSDDLAGRYRYTRFDLSMYYEPLKAIGGTYTANDYKSHIEPIGGSDKTASIYEHQCASGWYRWDELFGEENPGANGRSAATFRPTPIAIDAPTPSYDAGGAILDPDTVSLPPELKALVQQGQATLSPVEYDLDANGEGGIPLYAIKEIPVASSQFTELLEAGYLNALKIDEDLGPELVLLLDNADPEIRAVFGDAPVKDDYALRLNGGWATMPLDTWLDLKADLCSTYQEQAVGINFQVGFCSSLESPRGGIIRSYQIGLDVEQTDIFYDPHAVLRNSVGTALSDGCQTVQSHYTCSTTAEIANGGTAGSDVVALTEILKEIPFLERDGQISVAHSACSVRDYATSVTAIADTVVPEPSGCLEFIETGASGYRTTRDQFDQFNDGLEILAMIAATTEQRSVAATDIDDGEVN